MAASSRIKPRFRVCCGYIQVEARVLHDVDHLKLQRALPKGLEVRPVELQLRLGFYQPLHHAWDGLDLFDGVS